MQQTRSPALCLVLRRPCIGARASFSHVPVSVVRRRYGDARNERAGPIKGVPTRAREVVHNQTASPVSRSTTGVYA